MALRRVVVFCIAPFRTSFYLRIIECLEAVFIQFVVLGFISPSVWFCDTSLPANAVLLMFCFCIYDNILDEL